MDDLSAALAKRSGAFAFFGHKRRFGRKSNSDFFFMMLPFCQWGHLIEINFSGS
jgi:hypothetical protein